jgi:hypothetical protein
MAISKRSDEAYAALDGGTDALLSRFFLSPGGKAEKAASVLMNNSDPSGEDDAFCRRYGEALRTALQTEGLAAKSWPNSNYWTYSGDVETVRRLAVQAATVTGMRLDEDFVARLSTIDVTQQQRFVTICFKVEA